MIKQIYNSRLARIQQKRFQSYVYDGLRCFYEVVHGTQCSMTTQISFSLVDVFTRDRFAGKPPCGRS